MYAVCFENGSASFELFFRWLPHIDIVRVVCCVHTCMLSLADIVVWKQVYLLCLPWKRLKERCRLFYVLFVGIDSDDKRNTDVELSSKLGGQTDVLENDLVGNACVELVLIGVHMLKVNKEKLRIGNDLPYHILRSEESRVHAAMESPVTKFFKDFEKIIRMHERLATADGHTTAAACHDSPFLLDDCHQFVHAPFLAAHLERDCRTFLDALSAVDAILQLTWIKSVRTGLDTAQAADTFLLLEQTLALGTLAFRIVTPYATERAPLHEDGCADARSVVDGVTLDIEYQIAHY